MSLSLTVIKVGGSLLGDGVDLRCAAAAIAERRRRGEKLLVVVSALRGVTDLLGRAAHRAVDSHSLDGGPGRVLDELWQRHETVASGLADGGMTGARIQPILEEVQGLLDSIRVRGALPENLYCRLLSYGERLSVPLLVAAIQGAGADARGVTAEEVGLETTGAGRDSTCDVAASVPGLRGLLPDLKTRVVVLTGFYGVDQHGAVALFGRGGSDDTAAAVTAGLAAGHLELWKDTPGIMSADPRQVEGVRVVPELSFDEIAQLGAYGSHIVHHGSLEPLRGASTEIRICALGGLNGGGTRVIEMRRRRTPRVMALTGFRGGVEFRLPLPGDGLWEIARKVSSCLAKAGIPVPTITPRNGSICFTLADSEVGRAREALRGLVGRELEPRRFSPRIGAVGEGIATEPAIGSRILASLAHSKRRSTPQVEASGHSGLSCALREEELLPALRALHGQFFT